MQALGMQPSQHQAKQSTGTISFHSTKTPPPPPPGKEYNCHFTGGKLRFRETKQRAQGCSAHWQAWDPNPGQENYSHHPKHGLQRRSADITEELG